MRCLAALFAAAALGLYLVLVTSLTGLQDPRTTRKASRLAVNAAACFLWPALLLVMLDKTGQQLGSAAQLVSLVVLVYLCQEVRAVVPYVGPFDAYRFDETLRERSTQISTAAFAAGTILLSASDAVKKSTAPFVFLALLFCVLSAVPSGATQKEDGSGALQESLQKVSMGMAAGLLAVAMGMCVDAHLAP